MLVYSMTGYASAQQSAAAQAGGSPSARLGLELRSVNGRFLDLTLRLPEDLRGHEQALRELLQKQLKRGKVELRVFLEPNSQTGLIEPDAALLQRLGAWQKTIQTSLPQARALSVAEVLRLASSQQNSGQDWGSTLQTLVAQALQDLMQARLREGQRLAAVLMDCISQLRQLVAQATPMIPALVEQQRQRFLDRWHEAMRQTQAAVSQQAALERALNEASAYALRIDVAEELARLGSHLDEIERLLKRGGEAGKRLDFLIQELHREANTLGAKSATLDLSRCSVDMKVLIEQMREQVQNLE